MISRCEFLIGAGAGLIFPRFFERAFARFENYGGEILEAPETTCDIITASSDLGCGFQLLLGVAPFDGPPTMTVEASTALDISLLQHWLTELRSNIRLVVA